MMSTTLERTTAQEDAMGRSPGARVRRSIREIQECSHRALVASGATPGEAASAAAGVLHAELHHGEGLALLAESLADGAWRAVQVSCERSESSADARFAVDLAAPAGLLEVGAAVIGLVAGQDGPAVAQTPGMADPASSLVELALLEAAEVSGRTVAVTTSSEGGRLLRMADADLVVTIAWLPHRDPREPFPGMTVTAGVPVALEGAVGVMRSGPDERRSRRRAHARAGVEVDASAWRVVADRARFFLVPDQ